MVGFPRAPQVHGDTDDEASIHLYTQVGRAEPLPSRKQIHTSNLNKQFGKQDTIGEHKRLSPHHERLIQHILVGNDDSIVNGNNSRANLKENNLHRLNDDFNQFANTGTLDVSDEEFDPSDNEPPVREKDIYGSPFYNAPVDNGDESPVEDQEEPDIANQTQYESDEETVHENETDSAMENNGKSVFTQRSSPIQRPKANQSLFQQFERVRQNEEPSGRNKKKLSNSSNEQTSSSFGFLSLGGSNNYVYVRVLVVSFLFSIILLFVTSYPQSPKNILMKPLENYNDITSRFQKVESRMDKLDEVTLGLSNKQDVYESKYDSLTNSLNNRFNFISAKFDEFSQTLSLNNNSKFENLVSDFAKLKTKFDNLETISSNPEALEPKLNDISTKLNHLSHINNDIDEIKSDILNKLIESLPSQVPVYIKNNKIHYIPEFHKYLYNFVENYYNQKYDTPANTSTMDWNTFLSSNEIQLKNYINSSLNKNSNYKAINKEVFERLLQRKLNDNNRLMWQKFNNLIDNLNINLNSTNINISKSSNKILLDNLLEIFAKGSIKINYADYKIGSRILGFLTNTGADVNQNKSIVRKLFLGWYDYLNSNGLKNPKNWKFNANNVLIDGGNYWQCESSYCTFGVRLFNPVILTDLFLKTPLTNLPDDFLPPNRVSVYIKPKSPRQVNSLIEYINKFKINFKNKSNTNKYLTKFVKVKEVAIDSNKAINHIKFPISLINLRIPVRDLYIEISSKDGSKTGLYSFKAYGISEYNSYKYNEEFDLLLNKLYDQDQEEIDRDQEEFLSHFEDNPKVDYSSFEDDFDQGDIVLGDDEIIF